MFLQVNVCFTCCLYPYVYLVKNVVVMAPIVAIFFISNTITALLSVGAFVDALPAVGLSCLHVTEARLPS